ncbi:hypothetical protein BGZ70_006535 [Mortierella alpina]|uniref:Uncharacterized protein n=1 Tax=Mortierella alpina TaxID=64518 RepID=A0A9P6M3L7_MORAP|nr:hypothetical protein BGZ70_006535 [Mortierella alpina]
MAPSSTSSSRPTRTSAGIDKPKPTARTAKDSARPTVKRTPAKKSTATAAAPSQKPVKRRAAASKGPRKRTKQALSESEGEEQDSEDNSSDDGDDQEEDNYKDEDGSDDEEEVDSADDDFDDTSYVNTRKGASTPSTKKPTTTKKSPAKKPAAKKNASSNLKVVPTKTFLVSPLQIPHPKNGPFADAIQPETLEFIRDLKLNNDREYMMLNQDRCDQAKGDFMDFIRMVKEGLLEADPDVMDQEPKESMMRIYRDIRFSNDKSPYKSQLACHFSRGGKKSIAAGYYFGISSGGETFAGCGVWDPSGPVLSRIRQGLVNHSDRFKAILETDAIKKITNGRTGVDALRPGSSQLKTGPTGYDKDHEMIEYLKRKCFAVGRHFKDEEVVSEGFLEKVLETFDACVDLVHILNEWIG